MRLLTAAEYETMRERACIAKRGCECVDRTYPPDVETARALRDEGRLALTTKCRVEGMFHYAPTPAGVVAMVLYEALVLEAVS